MASRSYARFRARVKSRRVYRSLIRKPKRSVVKIAANFIGKSTYKRARVSRRGRRSFRRGYRRRRY